MFTVIYVYNVYLCYVCMSVTSAVVGTTKSTLCLRNAVYNIAQILQKHAFFTISELTYG